VIDRDRSTHSAPRRSDPRTHRRKRARFFDAIAPIVHRDSSDMAVALFQSRYDNVGPAAPVRTTSLWPMTKAAV